MDGYDEYSQQDYIVGNSEEQYPNNAREEMPVAALCAKLIKRKLLRDCVVMITSRPDESCKLGGIGFDRYVEITGFSPQQVKEYIEKYFRGNETMKNTVLEHVTNNENLVSFAHVPVLCFLMCFYLEYTLQESKSTDHPVSATDIYSDVVSIFELKHNAESEYKTKEIPEEHKASDVVESTLDKLSELAAQMLLKKRPVFGEGDMKEKFKSEEIETLKGSGLLHWGPPFRRSAFESTKQLSFTHLTIHEFLAARCFVMRNEIPKENVSEMVLQFMAGILSRKRDDKLMEILLESISSPQPSQPLGLLQRARCLNEYRDKEFAKNVIKNHPHHYFQCRNSRMKFVMLNDVDCIGVSFLLDTITELNEEQVTAAQFESSEQSFTVNSLTIGFYMSSLTLSGIKRICESLEKEHCAVTELNFSCCTLCDDSVALISLLSTKLTELCIAGADITDTGVAKLCEALQHSGCKVTTLDLSGNQITDTSVANLCEALQHSSCLVTILILRDSQITDTGVASLCEAFNLSGNKITDTGLASLCEALQYSSCQVTTLHLSDNNITDTGLTSLCETLQHSSCKVTTLNLSGNQISDTGVQRLRETLEHPSCKEITLITDTGVASPSGALQHPSCEVTEQDLAGNQITDAGFAGLCEALQHSSCKEPTLGLGYIQRITDSDVFNLFCELLENCKLTSLEINEGQSDQ
ncbi:hypothetical protein ACROYT_G022742 [Oculina patagonica]